MKQKVLVTGGCGYIGSVAVNKLNELGYEVHVADVVVNEIQNKSNVVKYHKVNILDLFELEKLFKTTNFDLVMHFAGLTQVKESMEKPSLYLKDNPQITINILECMKLYKVKKIIFSSTAAVFGQPENKIINEETPKNPINPYGTSKLICEQIIKSYSKLFPMKYIIFRYFNVAGADNVNNNGYNNPNPTHLIPSLVKNYFSGKESVIYGNDYETVDGTCIRDYIHVIDLVNAHIMAANYLDFNSSNEFNLGSGKGYSNLEVINSLQKNLGQTVAFKFANRRVGDPSTLVTDNSKI
jgi:UDP-glucose 4-epimerase